MDGKTMTESEWIAKVMRDLAEERGDNLTPEQRERRVIEDRLTLDPFLDDLRALLAKHPGIKWYIDPGDPSQIPQQGFDGIEFCYGLAVEWVYCEEYPVLRPKEDDD